MSQRVSLGQERKWTYWDSCESMENPQMSPETVSMSFLKNAFVFIIGEKNKVCSCPV